MSSTIRWQAVVPPSWVHDLVGGGSPLTYPGHGFVALEDGTEVLYKTTDFYHKASERSIRWDDPTLSIAWPRDLTPLLADKDAAAPLLPDADIFD